VQGRDRTTDTVIFTVIFSHMLCRLSDLLLCRPSDLRADLAPADAAELGKFVASFAQTLTDADLEARVSRREEIKRCPPARAWINF
jgi:hypothetical protein